MAKPIALTGADHAVMAAEYGVVRDATTSGTITGCMPLKRLQSISIDRTYTTSEDRELSNPYLVDISIDNIASTVNITENEWGSISNLAQFLGVYNYDHPHSGTITVSDFVDAPVDLFVKERQSSAETTVFKTKWLPNLYLTSLEMAYDVRGPSRITYRFEGSMDRDTINSYADAYVMYGTYSSSDKFYVNADLHSGYTMIWATVNGKVVSEGSQIHIYSTSGDKTLIQLLNYDSLEDGDRIALVFAKNSALDFPELSEPSTALGSVKKGQVKVVLGDSSTTYAEALADEGTLRLQSVTITVAPETEAKEQLGDVEPYAYKIRLPITITVAINALKSDLEEYNIIKDTPTLSGTANSNILVPSVFISNAQLWVFVYKDTTKTSDKLLKVIHLSNLRMTGDTQEATVDGDATLNWTMQTSYITISGTGVDPDS